jgi:hypothetical protein
MEIKLIAVIILEMTNTNTNINTIGSKKKNARKIVNA